jgi:hypothetical protein
VDRSSIIIWGFNPRKMRRNVVGKTFIYFWLNNGLLFLNPFRFFTMDTIIGPTSRRV